MITLKQIYQDLITGKLTQQEAVNRIKDLKLIPQTTAQAFETQSFETNIFEANDFETHLATPQWNLIASDFGTSSGQPDADSAGNYSQHCVILCETPDISAAALGNLLPGIDCLASDAVADACAIAVRYQHHALKCFELLKETLKARPKGKVLVQLVIINSAEQSLFVGIAALLKTAGLENPNLVGQVILIEPGTSASELATYLLQDGALLQSGSSSPATVIKHQGDARFTSNLHIVRNLQERGDAPAMSLKENGVYLITGGLGGLGILFAKEILQQTTQAKVILTGRRSLSAAEIDAELTVFKSILPSAIHRISYLPLDVTDLDQVEKLIASITAQHGTLQGIIHSAGMVRDNFMLKKSAEEFAEVLAPKVIGVSHLDLASRDLDLDFLVLSSSIAAWVGNLGQADYATANAFLDFFADHRNQLVSEGKRKGQTRSINWPFWIEGGMTIDQDSLTLLQETTGLRPMATATGMQAFYHSLALPHAQTFVMTGELTQMRRALLGEPALQSTPGETSELTIAPAVAPKTNAPLAITNISRDLFELTREYLCQQFSALLKVAANRIDPHAPMEKYGIESILAMNLTNQLEKTFGSLPKTLFFEYLTIHELSRYFVESHSEKLRALFAREITATSSVIPGASIPGNTPSSVNISRPIAQTRLTSFRRFTPPRNSSGSGLSKAPLASEQASAQSSGPTGIAIIGLSGRYPGANNLETYWENLKAGKNCIVEIPQERWDWRDYYTEDRTQDGRHFSKWGGFIDGVDEFDPRFFNISPREAESIDPQERLFLQHAWMAVEDAGYTRARLQIPDDQGLPGQVGVYVGVMYGEYNVSGTLASIANRVSYVLNIHGPSLTLDTMCSSSLTAIHLACQDLKQGRTHLAIAGGVNVSIHPNKYTLLSAGQFISSSGQCQSFGEGGDGYIPGEGVGALVLQRQVDAERDGNHIYGIIRGSGLNHGGKTNGYTVPNPQAQAEVISRVLREANINARHVSYIEAHGTGTKLGDPIEIAALNKAFHLHTDDKQFCLIGSAKSNLGHCESAAGIAGVTKILLQMQHQQIVPSLHSSRLNPHIDFAESPFEVNQQLRPWEQPLLDGKGVARIAGISSFGAGGSNAHILIEEYPAADVVSPFAGQEVIIPLSARTAAQLQQKAEDLLHFLHRRAESADKPLDLVAMAFTLQMGREAMNERVAFLVTSLEQLQERLTAFVASAGSSESPELRDTYRGEVKQHKDTMALFSLDEDLQQTIGKWLADKKLAKLVELWVKGWDLDWQQLYEGTKPTWISLPTYPFARERYWKDVLTKVEDSKSDLSAAKETNLLHPLLHTNTSDFFQQSYASRFTGKENFFTDLRADAQPKILPPMVHAEMVRLALAQAFPARPATAAVEFRHIAWAMPFLADGEKHLGVALLAKDSEQISFEFYSQSDEPGQEIIHCQGHALLDIGAAIPAPLNVERLTLQRASNECFLSLQPCDETADYLLHPALMNQVLAAAVREFINPAGLALTEQPMPVHLSVLRIFCECSVDMFAWIRYSAEESPEPAFKSLDIDLCDRQGKVCVQLQGLQYRIAMLETEKEAPAVTLNVAPAVTPNRASATASTIELPVASTSGDSALALEKNTGPQERQDTITQQINQINHRLANACSVAIPPRQTDKPKHVSLANPGDTAVQRQGFTALQKTMISLTDTQRYADPSIHPTDSAISVTVRGEGIVSLQFTNEKNVLSSLVAEQLLSALSQLKDIEIKVLILSGSEREFLLGGRDCYNDALKQGLYQAIVEFPYPVIAAMKGDASGAGFLVGALCDFMILNQESCYAYLDQAGGLYPQADELQLLHERFGETRVQHLLYSSKTTGRQLLDKGWNCIVSPADELDQEAFKLAQVLAQKSRHSLKILKQHLARNISTLTQKLKIADKELAGSASPQAIRINPPSKQLQLKVYADKILIVRVTANKKKNTLIEQLKTIVAKITPDSPIKALVITGDPSALIGLSEGSKAAILLGELQKTLVDSPVPVIAAFEQSLIGLDWLMALFCDACIYAKNTNYSIAVSSLPREMLANASVTLERHFGRESGWEIFCSGNAYQGSDLGQRAADLLLADEGQVLASALALAESWASLPLEYLTRLKKAGAVSIRANQQHFPERLELAPAIADPTLEQIPIAIASKVVRASICSGQVLLVKMEDRQAKNMFSDTLVDGLNAVKQYVQTSSTISAVVLTGYDNYFASGGTKKSLQAIQEGKAKFTDNKVFQFALDIPVPVIAAVQGHGIGAGWAMGIFADFIFLSKESKFLSPYMNFGFTPGAGSTYIFTRRTGYDLARETLLTAREYAGHELDARGSWVPVLPRDSVLSAAMTLAENLARISRESLIALKRQWVQGLLPALEETYALELAMHETTFVGHTDTLTQIIKRFGQDDETQAAQPQLDTEPQPNLEPPTDPELSAAPGSHTDDKSMYSVSERKTEETHSQASISASLRLLLAKELHLQEQEIDENTQFVDLGLDSITGVTWVRAINEKYKTTLEATRVYSNPTLAELSRHVKDEISKKSALPEQENLSNSVAPIAGGAIPAAQAPVYLLTTRASSGAEVLTGVRATLRKLLAEELHLQESEIDDTTQFIDLGLDSITGVTWVRKINEKYLISIEATKVYSHPTLMQLSQLVSDEIANRGSGAEFAKSTNGSNDSFVAPASVSAVSHQLAASDLAPSRLEMSPGYSGSVVAHVSRLTSWRQPASAHLRTNLSPSTQAQAIAVVGMAGQFPMARNIDEYWENIAQGKNCISEVSDKRWKIDTYYQQGRAASGKTNSKWLGALEEYDLFDPLFFNISPTEAESMDPQQRVFLQACWHSIENAGYSPQILSGSKCGVFVGCGMADYQLLTREHQISAQGFTGSATSILAARISYILNLQGPCLSIETACSSSLVAIATACDSLNSGASDLALAGGVCVISGPEMHIKTAQAGMLSTSGRCYTFDQRANGFVPGEAVGVLMLKRLADAQGDDDIIHGVIQGWGINQDGRTNGITAPNPVSQTRLQQDIYDKFNIDPANIQLIEAHGTGTKLGDPIEIEGLKTSFKKYTDKQGYCALGSVKSNIGHTLPAAGVAGVIKILLALKHKKLPPTINFENTNELIELQKSPFYINNRLQEWTLQSTEIQRQAAISSFGFSGTNAHMVIAEYVSPATASRPAVIAQHSPAVVILSAKTDEQLRQKARDLCNFIDKESIDKESINNESTDKESNLDIVQLAYTLQVGREAMEERLGLLVSDLGQLKEKLDAFVNGNLDIEGCYRGQVRRNKEGLSIISQDDEMKETIIVKWLANQQIAKLLDLWVKGLDLDWNRLYSGKKPQRICLPNYPFAKQRYWVDPPEPALMVAALHPLLHINSSDLSHQRYTSRFTGNEFFLRDYRLDWQGLNLGLPAAAYLEMARAAVVNAVPEQLANKSVTLRNFVWAKGVSPAQRTDAKEKTISITLSANDNDLIDIAISSVENQQALIHCEGQAAFNDPCELEIIDIQHLKTQLQENETAVANLYQAFASAGIHYGPAMQGLRAIYSSANQVLAELVIPTAINAQAGDYYCHPLLLESALQACSLLVEADSQHLSLVPRTLASMTLHAPCRGEMFAWIRPSPDAAPYSMNIELCDAAGNICATLAGLQMHPVNGRWVTPNPESHRPSGNTQHWDGMSYVYRWQEQPSPPITNTSQSHKNVVIVCSSSSFGFENTIRSYYQQNTAGHILLIRIADKTRQIGEGEWLCGMSDPQGFDTCLNSIKKIDALYFLALSEQDVAGLLQTTAVSNLQTDNQECNEIQLLRLVKNIKQGQKIDKKVDTYLLTSDNYMLNDHSNQHWGAGVAGLGYSLAQGNYQFRVRNLDLSSDEVMDAGQHADIYSRIVAEPSSDRGEIVKIQSGKGYRKQFLKLQWEPAVTAGLKQGGVYLIVGGSGIVGRVFTRYLIEKYSARVVWLGRAAENSEKIQSALGTFAGHSKPFYVKADTLKPDEMRDAVTIIKEKYGTIQGAIFSGMVFGIENSIDQTTEADFREILTVKTQGARIFYNAFKDEPLDFMCYFSSGQAYSFSGASKLSAYATGITFHDSFVRSIKHSANFPVGIINWGFWKTAVTERIEKLDGVSTGSLDALEDQEGFVCFERFVAELQQGRISQVLCMRASREVEALMNCQEDEFVTLFSGNKGYPALTIDDSRLVPEGKIARLISEQAQSQLDSWLIQLLGAQLTVLVNDARVLFPVTPDQLRQECRVLGKYLPWWNESIAMLARNNAIDFNAGLIQSWNIQGLDTQGMADVWSRWSHEKEIYIQNPDTKALTILIDECLTNLPHILQGRIPATDIIFPNSSIEKVAGLYKNNVIADTFNEIVANAVVSYLQQRLQLDPQARVKILEIGAGTGGTSSVVFSRLSPYKDSVEEYTYTDLSKAFFFHAEKNYLPDNPYIVCQRLNIEESIDGQGIETGSYDLVLATNVLHATQNVAQTLANTKAALRQGGYLILNEMSEKSLSTHLTFGLLDGWWLFEDSALRIAGCPGIYPDAWRKVLESEGFNNISFPARKGHGLGNQIILAQSDGIVRQKNSLPNKNSSCNFPVAAQAPIDSTAAAVVAKEQVAIQIKTPAKIANKNLAQTIHDAIIGCLSNTLKLAPESIHTDIAFSDYGIDSILGVNFIEQINKRFAISLNTAVIFEYSSIERLSAHIKEAYSEHIESQVKTEMYSQLNAQPAVGTVADLVSGQRLPLAFVGRAPSRLVKTNNTQSPAPQADTEEIAVIGISGKFPGAENIDEFWHNLITGVDGVEELPANYLDQKNFYNSEKQKGKTRCKWGGILRDRDCFDPLFFNISPKEAESMNPHQRLVMQESWNAIEDAGYNPKTLSGSSTGIFVGAEPVGYVGETFTGISDAIIASRLSYVLNLNGPAFVVNTGCSSSGVAIHLACDSLRKRETDLVLAGGVNACMHQNIQIRLDSIEMLSPSGRCFTFDTAGDGTIISEGIGMVVLKRLDDAIADRDHIYGVISGSGINQDGASNGITAPSGAAQEKLITGVYDRFNINPEDISYVEAHGTGTKLGDPVETNALVRAFKKYTDKKGYCAVGSAKSHIGHAAAAAGVIGLIKVLLSMKHEQLPRLLNFNSLNPLIEFGGSPFFITTATTEWTSQGGQPRMAAINSFGHSGTNVHMVVKEYISVKPGAHSFNGKSQTDCIIPLSAKTREQLQEKVQKLLQFIERSHLDIDLVSMAFTLQLGRESMEERVGVVCQSILELSEKLQAIARGEKNTQGVYQGNAKQKTEVLSTLEDGKDINIVIDQYFTENKLNRLLQLWVKGIALDWNRFYSHMPEQKPGRMSLPGYPFAKERYWVDSFIADAKIPLGSSITPQIHREHKSETIEDIINKIDDDSVEIQQGIRMLKNIV